MKRFTVTDEYEKLGDDTVVQAAAKGASATGDQRMTVGDVKVKKATSSAISGIVREDAAKGGSAFDGANGTPESKVAAASKGEPSLPAKAAAAEKTAVEGTPESKGPAA